MKGKHCRLTELSLFTIVISIFLVLSGCMVGPNFKPPETKSPPVWTGVPKVPPAQPSVVTTNPAELVNWWRVFADPKLTALEEEAVKANLDIQLAQARLRQARFARAVIVGGLWPSLSTTASYERTHQGLGNQQNTGTAASSGAAAAPAAARVSVPYSQNLYQAGLDALWELDVFGGIRRNVESADANVLAAQESIRDTLVTLVAEVALNYIQLRGFQQQIIIAERNLRSQQHTADITRERLGVGFVSALDVANAEAQVATTAAQIPVLEAAEQQTIYTLSVLLGRPPAYLLDDLETTGSLPAAPREVPVGLPSDLLRRRPDIRVAEAQLHAATAQIGVATAQLFPAFSLTGSLNYRTNVLRYWFRDQSEAWAFGPAASWSLFQGGSLVANIHVQEALRDEAFITYEKTVLAAFQDVENALVAFNKEWEHRKALNDAVIANAKAVDLSMKLYIQGQTEFLNVLNAERSLYASENALVLSDQSIAADLIALYKALGGGWELEPSQSPAAMPLPLDPLPPTPRPHAKPVWGIDDGNE